MNREDIIRMAREAGIAYRARIEEFNSPLMDGVNLDDLAKFAALVSAASASVEREACAKACDFAINSPYVSQIAAAIRARGQA